ncbi:MAG: hypothetical protein WBF88_17535 [Pusillimonas sp.]
MAYLTHSPNVAIRGLSALTGTEDAEVGSTAVTPEGDKYVLTASGWLQVYSAEGEFTPTLPDGTAVTVVSGDESISLPLTVVDGVVTIPEGYTLSEDDV